MQQQEGVAVTLIHATCVAISGEGVLLRGAAGSGKSDLALRLIDGGGILVADDQVALSVRDGRLIAASPASIAGRIEVRGVAIATLPHAAQAPVTLAVDLVAPLDVERLPEPSEVRYLGIQVPLVALAPFEPSAAAKVRLAVRIATRDIKKHP